MNVVLDAQRVCNPAPRGIPIYTIQLIRSLLKRKQFDYSLTFFDKDKERGNRQYIDKYFGEFDVPVFECNSESYKTLLESDTIYRNISHNELTKTKGDIYHFTHFVPIPTRLEGKMVVTVHDLIPFLLSEELLAFDKKGLSQFEYWWNKMLECEPTIIAVSETTKADIFRLFGYENVHVVLEGYDECQFYPEQDPEVLNELNIHSPYIFYCGALDMRKNILRILDAYEEVLKDFPNMTLVLAGAFATNSEPIREKLSKMKGNPNIIVPGYITDRQKRILMSGASVFLFPSIYEGFGLPILEAMACGTPVITSNISSMPEVAGDAAVLIDPYDTVTLAEAVKKVISSPKVRENLRQRGFIHTKKFLWDKTAENVECVYKKVMGCL